MFLSFVLLVAICLTGVVKAEAAGDSKVMQAIVTQDETTVKAYVKGASGGSATAYQIGNIAADVPKGYQISEDSEAMRTLIMLDNSLSIPQNSRPLMKEMVKAILDAHGEKETFRLATFSDKISYLSDQYSTDYTLLKSVVDSVEHVDQETYLTDVLYGVIDELNAEKYDGYTRIIIFSDGVDNKPLTVTREALNKKLEESPYPVYTIGSRTGKNDSELSNMFALSTLMGCESLVLEETNASELAQITSQDNSIMVFETTIPEEAKTGGTHSSKLTLSDGTNLVFDVHNMPFAIKEDAPEPVVEEKEDEPVKEEKKEEPVSTTPKPTRSSFPSWIILPIIAAVILAIIITVIVLVVSSAKKKKKTPEVPKTQAISQEYEKTEMLNAKPKHGDNGTVQMTPDGNIGQVRRYRFTLTDAADSSRSFRCELISQIKIGRQPDNNIVISDDTTVHGHQSIVSVENDVVKYEDLKQVQNHSSVNGVALSPGIPKLIITNSKVTIGRHTYVVSIERQ